MLPMLLTTILLAAAADPAPKPPPFTFEDGDRVVLIGSTLIEREQRSGYWEAALTARYPHKNITFRNLGWSGDDVRGIARNSFDGSPAGFNRLRDGVLGLKPTVLVIAYGGNESFDGAAGLEKFKADYEKLLDTMAPTKARLILIAPPRQENMGPPLPDPTAHNKDLQLYGKAIGEIAKKRGAVFVDLYGGLDARYAETRVKLPLTDNSLHFTPTGYLLSAEILWNMPKSSDWLLDFKDPAKPPETKGLRMTPAVRQGDTVRFAVTSEILPTDPPPSVEIPSDETTAKETLPNIKDRVLADLHTTRTFTTVSILPSPEYLVHFRQLPAGNYTLKIDGQKVAEGDAKEWEKGVTLYEGPDFKQAQKLRAAIIEKNRLYFHRWRPQNETYLFGFRRGEQGQNAREVPLFEPLVVKAEEEIAKLRVPTKHTYELTREAAK